MKSFAAREKDAPFEIETLQDWCMRPVQFQDISVGACSNQELGACNSNSSNNSATEP